MEDNYIEEKEDYKAIRLRGFDYNLFEEEEGGCARKRIYGYPYSNHLIKLWLGNWEDQLVKINDLVRENI